MGRYARPRRGTSSGFLHEERGYDTLQLMVDITVIKRDGEKEAFDLETIQRVVKAAGLNDEEAKMICLRVENWLQERGKAEVTSVQIRDYIIIELQKLNRTAAQSFIDYEKYRDKTFDATR